MTWSEFVRLYEEEAKVNQSIRTILSMRLGHLLDVSTLPPLLNLIVCFLLRSDVLKDSSLEVICVEIAKPKYEHEMRASS